MIAANLRSVADCGPCHAGEVPAHQPLRHQDVVLPDAHGAADDSGAEEDVAYGAAADDASALRGPMQSDADEANNSHTQVQRQLDSVERGAVH